MSEEYITLDGLCQQLSISRATGRNWLRLGKIESQGIDPAGQMYFTEEYVSNLNSHWKLANEGRSEAGGISGMCPAKDCMTDMCQTFARVQTQ